MDDWTGVWYREKNFSLNLYQAKSGAGFYYNSLDLVKVILGKLQYHPIWLQIPTIEIRVFTLLLVSMFNLLYLND